jgi:small conductance mechanosensitive channel
MKFLPKFLQFNDSLVRFIVISFLAIILVISCIHPALSQFSLPNKEPKSITKPPEGVTRYGEIEVSYVKSFLDGRKLFPVTSPTIFDRTKITEDQLPVEVRSQEITARLQLALTGRSQIPKSVEVTTSILNNLPVVFVQDDFSSRPLKIVTVTDIDAEFLGKTLEEVAQQWSKDIDQELKRGIEIFSKEKIIKILLNLLKVAIIIPITSFLIWLLQRYLFLQKDKLKTKQEAEIQAELSEITDDSDKISWMYQQFLTKLKYQLTPNRQLRINSLIRWFLFWLQIALWYSLLLYTVSTMPILMIHKNWVISVPFKLILILFIANICIKLSNLFVDRFTHVLGKHQILNLGEAQRKLLRSTTIGGAIKSLLNFILIIWAIIEILKVFTIDTNSLIALGTIIGLAITFGTQNLVKDLVNGCLILVEDQFAVGDFIDLGTTEGLVENLNLRITQIRDNEGRLITIPNSSITQVKNLTRLWSRVNFTVEVAYETDIDQVLNLLKKITKQMYSELEWQGKILEPPRVLGVDALSHNGMLLKVWIKTQPLEQWNVGREFRYRVRKAFEENHILIGKPQLISYNANLETN